MLSLSREQAGSREGVCLKGMKSDRWGSGGGGRIWKGIEKIEREFWQPRVWLRSVSPEPAVRVFCSL